MWLSHKPGGRLPLLSARPAVRPTSTTLKRAATNFAACWTEARWVWTVCLRLLPDSVATAIWTRALLHAPESSTLTTRLPSHPDDDDDDDKSRPRRLVIWWTENGEQTDDKTLYGTVGHLGVQQHKFPGMVTTAIFTDTCRLCSKSVSGLVPWL